jgi:formate-dependent nitrite reductase membrane component NrfD
MSDFERLPTHDSAGEDQLQKIQEQAFSSGEEHKRVGLPTSDIAHSSGGANYYGRPILKPPAWTFEVPLYFFTGGVAGAAAVIAGAARIAGADPFLARDARHLAAFGGAISPVLLISDLGMPSRFLNMLRVLKFQSPMSVGSWTLVAFSSTSAAAAFLGALERRGSSRLVRTVSSVSQFLSLLLGGPLASYTGVLIGATAIPVWSENAGMLPVHFAASGIGAAVGMLELRDHRESALNTIGIAAAAAETFIAGSIEVRKNPKLNALKSGKSGWLTRAGGLLSGPLPLALRLCALASGQRRSKGLRKTAALFAIAGSIVTRYAWLRAGRESAAHPD